PGKSIAAESLSDEIPEAYLYVHRKIIVRKIIKSENKKQVKVLFDSDSTYEDTPSDDIPCSDSSDDNDFETQCLTKQREQEGLIEEQEMKESINKGKIKQSTLNTLIFGVDILLSELPRALPHRKIQHKLKHTVVASNVKFEDDKILLLSSQHINRMTNNKEVMGKSLSKF
ncbi:hypothetical protein HHI36_013083, partial [Cryptolaemus montrouzieri]